LVHQARLADAAVTENDNLVIPVSVVWYAADLIIAQYLEENLLLGRHVGM
jgi:hypothetical protein